MHAPAAPAVGSAHAQAVFRFAKAILREASRHTYPHNGQSVRLRVGLHSGPIVSGVIGRKMPKFCLFGDTMNTASRMETTCAHGSIHVSEATYRLLQDEILQYTGGVEVKGKGRMDTYLYTPPPRDSVAGGASGSSSLLAAVPRVDGSGSNSLEPTSRTPLDFGRIFSNIKKVGRVAGQAAVLHVSRKLAHIPRRTTTHHIPHVMG